MAVTRESKFISKAKDGTEHKLFYRYSSNDRFIWSYLEDIDNERIECWDNYYSVSAKDSSYGHDIDELYQFLLVFPQESCPSPPSSNAIRNKLTELDVLQSTSKLYHTYPGNGIGGSKHSYMFVTIVIAGKGNYSGIEVCKVSTPRKSEVHKELGRRRGHHIVPNVRHNKIICHNDNLDEILRKINEVINGEVINGTPSVAPIKATTSSVTEEVLDLSDWLKS